MAPSTVAEQNLAFLYTVLKHSDLKPNWWAIGAEHSKVKEAKKSQKDLVQQKFKKLIESTGKYALVNGKVVDLEEDPDAAPPTTPAKRGRGGRAAGTNTPRSTGGRKRKAAAPKEDSDENESDAEGTPVKKRSVTKRTAAKLAADKVKAEASDEDGDNDGIAEKSGDGDGNENDSDDDFGDHQDPQLVGGSGRVANPDDI